MTTNKITSLKSLLQELDCGTGLDGYLGLMHNLRLSKEEVLPYCTWNSQHYTRNLVAKTSQFELIIMCWEPGQSSPIHSYNNEQGWMYVVDGQLNINHYFESYGEAKMQYYKEVQLHKGAFLYVNDYLGFHSAINATQARTISLHLHAGPVEKWKVYDPKSNAYFKTKTRIDKDFQPK